MIMKRFAILMIAALIGVVTVAAQANINKVVAKIEKDSDTDYVAYNEQRDPSTHKVIRSTKVLVINDKMAKMLRDAIERDREKAVSIEMSKNRYFALRFISGERVTNYTLYQQRNGKWLLSVEDQYRRKRTAVQRISADLDPFVWIIDI